MVVYCKDCIPGGSPGVCGAVKKAERVVVWTAEQGIPEE